jgi:hypothetical protein
MARKHRTLDEVHKADLCARILRIIALEQKPTRWREIRRSFKGVPYYSSDATIEAVESLVARGLIVPIDQFFRYGTKPKLMAEECYLLRKDAEALGIDASNFRTRIGMKHCLKTVAWPEEAPTAY